MKNNYKTFNGYIEGYYGRLLNWEERSKIISKLKTNKMNFYFYAPKEDEKHRLLWKLEYDKPWALNFKNFCKKANLNYIKVIVGISPGISFNFQDFAKHGQKSEDFNTLLKKCQFFLNNGADEIALLFDDLPNNFKVVFGKRFSEGYVHASLANQLLFFLKRSIYVVPRIYADQLILEDKNYLVDFGKFINKKNITFYSGKNIVSRLIDKSTILNISKIIPTRLVIWDNFYSNDYCPRRIFLGPYIGRSSINNIMINPTGLIETDLLILDIVKATKNSLKPKIAWKKVLIKHNIPMQFYAVSDYFLKPDFGNNPRLRKYSSSQKIITSLDFLLWKWKSPLSREWFPFLLGLKHDLQIIENSFSSERVIKTQTKALANYIIKR
jgi:hypothetical protein